MLTRKAFLVQLAGGGWILGGCGGGGSDYGGAPAPAPAPAGGCRDNAISGNHGHAVTIARADLDSTAALTYAIQGTAAHNHAITLSAAQLAQLKAGQTVTVTSTEAELHSHVVTVACT